MVKIDPSRTQIHPLASRGLHLPQVHNSLYTGYKFTGSQTISGSYIDFVQCDFDAGTGGVNVTGSNITFTGSRFQSNSTAGADYNVQVTGSNVTFSYDTISPRVAQVASPPGSLWPSAGAATV